MSYSYVRSSPLRSQDAHFLDSSPDVHIHTTIKAHRDPHLHPRPDSLSTAANGLSVDDGPWIINGETLSERNNYSDINYPIKFPTSQGNITADKDDEPGQSCDGKGKFQIPNLPDTPNLVGRSKLSPVDAYARFWKLSANFRIRSTRGEYSKACLANVLTLSLLLVIGIASPNSARAIALHGLYGPASPSS